jgi:hypothetical protein
VKTVENYNRKLRELLGDVDEVAALSTGKGSKEVGEAIPDTMLDNWKHASSMYKLMASSWRCACQSHHYAQVWLEPSYGVAELRMRVVAQASQAKNGAAMWATRDVRLAVADRAACRLYPKIDDLCDSVDHCGSFTTCLGPLNDPGAQQGYCVLLDRPASDVLYGQSLYDLLRSGGRSALGPRARLTTVLALTSAYLRLYCTSWWASYILDRHIQFISADRTMIPYVEARFDRHLEEPDTKEGACKDLAVILLELFFGCRIQECPHWREVHGCKDRAERFDQ